MSPPTLCADGSAGADAHPPVTIDRDVEGYRWRCPRGHTDWDRTNNHLWCRSCYRAHENGADVSPEYYELLDDVTGETVPYAAVEFVGGL